LTPATCLPDGCFCEAVRSAGIAQPANFWSSFAFVGVAMLLWIKRAPPLLAVAVFLVGAGSAAYHGTLTFAGQVADMSGMYFVVTFAILHGLERKEIIGARGAAVAFVIGNVLLAWGQVMWPDARRYVFAALIVAMLLAERGMGWSRFLNWAVVVFAAGFGFWVIDKTHVVCSAQSLLQGHAVWHLCGAAAAWLLYEHLRTISQSRKDAKYRQATHI
jgi:hypothetical protein